VKAGRSFLGSDRPMLQLVHRQSVLLLVGALVVREASIF
jgi:hypothetical protein